MRTGNRNRETDVFVFGGVYEKHNVCFKTRTIRRYIRSKRKSTFCLLVFFSIVQDDTDRRKIQQRKHQHDTLPGH